MRNRTVIMMFFPVAAVAAALGGTFWVLYIIIASSTYSWEYDCPPDTAEERTQFVKTCTLYTDKRAFQCIADANKVFCTPHKVYRREK